MIGENWFLFRDKSGFYKANDVAMLIFTDVCDMETHLLGERKSSFNLESLKTLSIGKVKQVPKRSQSLYSNDTEPIPEEDTGDFTDEDDTVFTGSGVYSSCTCWESLTLTRLISQFKRNTSSVKCRWCRLTSTTLAPSDDNTESSNSHNMEALHLMTPTTDLSPSYTYLKVWLIWFFSVF